MLFAIAPASIYLISALVFSHYPITRETHRTLRDRLAARTASPEEEKSRSIA
jgi:Na+/melibiose symporter-like transporter